VQTTCRLVSEGKIVAIRGASSRSICTGSSLSDEAFLKFVHRQITSFRIEPTAICFEYGDRGHRNLSSDTFPRA